MATLAVEATVSAGVIGYTLIIDRQVVPMGGDGKGTCTVSGNCGDGSKHQLLYGFEGPAGETLSVTITCAGTEVGKLKEARITPASDPFGGGKKDFSL